MNEDTDTDTSYSDKAITCYICLESDGKLIHPCGCNSAVHESCLNEQIENDLIKCAYCNSALDEKYINNFMFRKNLRSNLGHIFVNICYLIWKLGISPGLWYIDLIIKASLGMYAQIENWGWASLLPILVSLLLVQFPPWYMISCYGITLERNDTNLRNSRIFMLITMIYDVVFNLLSRSAGVELYYNLYKTEILWFDHQVAGLGSLLMLGIVLLIYLLYLFLRWFARYHPGDDSDELSSDEIVDV